MARTGRLAAAAAAMLLLAVAVAGQVVGQVVPANTFSKLWGINGERWTPSGPLPDFSFAGYHQGNDPLPTPDVTRSVLTFRRPGMTDTQMLVAAVKWAHLQNVTASGYTVLFIPAGTYTLTERLWIKKSRIVIRGAGAGRTVLNIPKSLWDVYGKSGAGENGRSESGGYVNWGGFISVQGNANRGARVSLATGSARKGDYSLTVRDGSLFKAGQYYDTWWTDVGGRFNSLQFDGKARGPDKYIGSTRMRFTVKVTKVVGNRISLERPLPYAIGPKTNIITFTQIGKTVTEVGVEGLTFRFKWELYAGHHLERGWNAIDIAAARDCWVRDIEIINPDSGVLINYLASSITVKGVKIWYTKTRANNRPNAYDEPANADGHWGFVYSVAYDCLFTDFTFNGTFMHDVGTGMQGKWGVFANGKLRDGNLDLHRGLAGPTLYTNIDVGKGTKALNSGGPKSAGPNSVAFSTWWNIRSARAVGAPRANERPPSCAFGTSINLIGVNLNAEALNMCPSWLYERKVRLPANIYEAQLARRKARKSR